MEQLIRMLTELEDSSLKAEEFVLDDNYPLVKEIRGLLDEVLITEDGNVDWENRKKLLEAGWYSYPYEQDRFGWLLGALVTKKGDIVFG